MTVTGEIERALRLVGRADIAEALTGGSLNKEQTEAVNTLLYCFNAVEDELARKFLPLRTVQTAEASEGRVYYAQLPYTPLRVRRAIYGGREIAFKLFPLYIQLAAEGSVTLEYDYSPKPKSLGDDSDYCDGEEMIACGMAAEYCLINGEVAASERWEKKYLEQADVMMSKRVPRGYLPLRSWV